MQGEDWGRLAYLLLLLVAVGGYFASHRQKMSANLQQAAIWGFIFLGAIGGYGLWNDIRGQVLPERANYLGNGVIEVPRSFDGHYYLRAAVNGVPVDFVVDTGASDIVLTQEDARRAGIDLGTLAFAGRANTANGTVPTAGVRLEEFRLGDIVDRNVPASVNGGTMDGSLLGMSYLQRFARIEIANGKLVLHR